jgi:hypothetical protein
MRNGDVYLALEELSTRAAVGWPINRFREALDIENEEGRWQNLNAALNGIRQAVNL